ncbi:MAG: Uncharacterized protein XD63_0153 [Thermoanaerobacterales bacterium 50_218]|nr:MAG: Uncharacterized protein XD63_0153 [Thermoanaerobacterales bacterium 50_218]HAA89470.1 hypothetical protein [Peptococcaceae bacterium]
MNEEKPNERLRFKIRFDYRGESRPGRLFWGGKDGEQIAEEIREQEVILLRNIPYQGVEIKDINTDGEIYLLRDESSGREIAYAPVEFILEADAIEDVIPFLLREEFRKVELLHPQTVTLTKNEVERIIYKLNEKFRNYRIYLEKRLSSK